MLKRNLVIAILLLLATVAGAHAATLTTAPFPGFTFETGSASCNVANFGTKPGTVKMELLGTNGGVLETDGPFTLLPGNARQGTPAGLAFSSAATCRITVPSKTRYRGSFSFINGDAPPTVIPAQ